MTDENLKCVETQMLIRKPVEQIFQAFIDPTITTNFWFTKSSGQLEAGKTVTWEWEMYGVSTNVLVKEIIQNKKKSTEWGDPATTVDYEFTALTDDTTYVVIKNYGFNLTGDELKAFLEHNINLNLIADKFPEKVTQHGQ